MSQKPKKVPVILQMEALECGAASLCMVLAYYKKWVPLDQVRSDCGVSRDGSNALNIWKAAEGYGMKVKANRFKVEQLQKEATFLAIIWWNHNHFVVLDGFKKGKAVINDPAKGVVRMPIPEFEQNYSMLCMQFEPTEKFEPGGKPQSILAFLKKRIKGNRATLLLVMLTGALSVAAGVLMPVFSRVFTDEILGGDNRDWLTPFLLLFGALILFRLIAGALNAKAIQRATGKIAITSNAQFMWHILRMPMGFFAQRMAGDLSGRQQSNDQVANTLIRQLAPTVMNMVLLVLYLIVMIQYSPLLTAIGVFTILLNILLVQIITQKVSMLLFHGMPDSIAHFPLVAGRMPAYGENNACALDKNTAFKLFSSVDVVGSNVNYDGNDWMIVGILDIDDPVFIAPGTAEIVYDHIAVDHRESLTTLVTALGDDADPFNLSGSETTRLLWILCGIPWTLIVLSGIRRLRRRSGGWKVVSNVAFCIALLGIVIALMYPY